MIKNKRQMLTNKIRLESGQEYTLNQIFNGTNKIVIPDLQRDYCWGDKAWNEDEKSFTELVSGFIDSLISAYDEKSQNKLTLGLIYGYENPHFIIQLCDGQQRLTTLFLLVGMINRRTDNNHFKNILISDFELTDDNEPNLLYAIRESTLYFLSDLVCKFFLEQKKIEVDDIYKQDWYFNEYNLDASIQSMLSAIKIIDDKLSEVEDCKRFGEFITANLQMFYYDMGHRTRGEETFVVINTTGEPLTATENLKPILIGNIEDENEKKIFSDEWEGREEWFWQNRRISSEQTSDDALEDFFIWYWQIRLLQEKSWKGKKSYSLNPNELFQKKPILNDENEENPEIHNWEQSKNLDKVQNYFVALVNLVNKSQDENIKRVLRTIYDKDISLTWFREVSIDVVLPLISYLNKFPNSTNFYKFVRRIRKNYFDNIWNDRKKNYVDWRHIIQIIDFSENEKDVLIFQTKNNSQKFKNISNVELNEWFNDEEKLKHNLAANVTEIEAWEDHKFFMGDLSFIFSLNKNDTSNQEFLTLEKYFNNYTAIIDSILNQENDPKTNNFRLFLFYIGCAKVEHKSRVSWEIEGVLFSSVSREHLINEEFANLCKQDDLEKYCFDFIKRKSLEWNLFDLDELNFTTEKALKCWLTLKVLYANHNNVCLAYYDGRNGDEGVSVYKNANKNRLIDSEPFSKYNMICGFGVKAGGGGSYIDYTNTGLWLKPNIIDSPIEGFSYEDRTLEQLNYNKKTIDFILGLYINKV